MECRNRGEEHPELFKDDSTAFNLFRDQVRSLYPDLQDERQWTNVDLRRLMERTQWEDDMTRRDLGEYLRTFIKIAQYLVSQDRLSEREKASRYLDGFPSWLRRAVLHRLLITDPHVIPDDGYPFPDIHSAAEFVLTTRNRDADHGGVPSTPTHTPVDAAALSEFLDKLTKSFASITHPPQQFVPQQQYMVQQPYPLQPQPYGPQSYAPQQQYLSQPPVVSNQQAPQQRYLPPQQQAARVNHYQAPPAPGQMMAPPPRRPLPDGCVFCSELTHYIRDCPLVTRFLVEGKIHRLADNKIRLPNGNLPSNALPGRNMSERVLAWHASQGIHNEQTDNVLSANFLENIDESVFTVDYAPEQAQLHVSGSSSSDVPDKEEQIRILEAQLASLREENTFVAQEPRKKVRFDGVDVPAAPYDTGRKAAPPPSTLAPGQGPTILARGRPLNADSDSKTLAPSLASRLPPKSEEKPRDRSQERPCGPMRPVNYEPRLPAEEAKSRYQSAIETGVKTSDLVDRVLDAPITVTTRELLAAAGGVRHAVKDLVVSKKVAVNLVEEPIDAYLTQCFDSAQASDPDPIVVDYFRYAPSSPVAFASLPLRVIYADFGNGVKPECILDGGAQSILMRRDIWEKLRVPIAVNRATVMQSANSTSERTEGMVEDLPVTVGKVTVYLQVHVVKNAPFEVLFGRPFFDVTNCAEISNFGGEHVIHIRDPQTGNPYTYPTEPRNQRRTIPKANRVNFQG